jgi:hypothetical protein
MGETPNQCVRGPHETSANFWLRQHMAVFAFICWALGIVVGVLIG